MQNKFVKSDTKLISMIEKLKDEEIKRRNLSFNHEVFHTRHSTQCPRRTIYRVNATTQVNATPISFNEENNCQYVKKKWVDFFSNTRGIILRDKNVVAADCNYNLIGQADAIIEVENVVSVLLIEALNPSEYKTSIETKGLRNNIVDLMMVMWLTEIKNGILLYENTSNQEHYVLHVIPYQPIINSVVKKYVELMNSKLFRILPDRPYEDNSNEECLKCEYNKTCWE